MKVKIITGFRNDQFYVIDGEEAHKAYYIFLHPEARVVFNNGVALIGKNIDGIEPAYNETMGWNPSHKLDDDDWNEIRGRKLDNKFQELLAIAKNVAYLAEKDISLIRKSLPEAQLQLT